MVRAVSIRNGARREARLRLAKEQTMSDKPLVSEDVCWHCHQIRGSQAEARRLERSYRLTSEALDQSQADLYKALSETERLRAVLTRIVQVYEDGDDPCLDLRLSDIARKALTQ